MTIDLQDVLSQEGVSDAVIRQAAGYLLAERTDDIDPEEMLITMAGPLAREELDATLAAMESAPELVTQGALVILAAVWDEPGGPEVVTRAVSDAKQMLPVIEIALLAIVTMYGLYLIATGGIKESKRTVEKKPDGTIKVIEAVTYHDPRGPLSTIGHLLAQFRGQQ
jgi:hypothetical protein